jgi:hypothetical protein
VDCYVGKASSRRKALRLGVSLWVILFGPARLFWSDKTVGMSWPSLGLSYVRLRTIEYINTRHHIGLMARMGKARDENRAIRPLD